MALDITKLPPPALIDRMTYRQIEAERLASFRAIDPDYTGLTQADPAVILLQEAAYRELLIRAAVDDAGRTQMLAFASGANLDYLGDFYGVTRLVGEGDDSLRARIRERSRGSSTAGPAAHYRYHALSASPLVKDVAVDSPTLGVVRVTVLSAETDSAASPDLLSAVAAVVLADDVRVLTDTVQVVPAEIIPARVAAAIWLYPDAPAEVVDLLRATLPAALDAVRGLGWDLTRSWLTARLHGEGVQRVALAEPAGDLVIGPQQCVALGSLALTYAGRDR